MRSTEPLREIFHHLHLTDWEWGAPTRPGTGWSAGSDVRLDPLLSGVNDWERDWIDLGGEG